MDSVKCSIPLGLRSRPMNVKALLPNDVALLILRNDTYSASLFICLFGLLTSPSATRLYRGRVQRLTSGNFTCCHTETAQRDHDFCLSQSHYTDIDPTIRAIYRLSYPPLPPFFRVILKVMCCQDLDENNINNISQSEFKIDSYTCEKCFRILVTQTSYRIIYKMNP